MSTTQTVQPLTPVNPNHPAIDPNVVIPDRVRNAAAAAEAAHAALYAQPSSEAAEPAPEPAAEPAAPPQAAEPAAPPAPAEPAQPATAPMSEADKQVSAEEWRHRFLSMQGRYNAAMRQVGSMEQQMQQLGQELVGTQNLLAQLQQNPGPQAPHARHHENVNLITDEDREAYGDDLINLAQRAAREVFTPEIERLRQENEQLTRRVQNTGKRELFATLDATIPNWRAINKSPQFITWLRLPNIYTGQLRQVMLKEAVDGAEAPKVIALFRDFLAEANATGAEVPAPQSEPPASAPRTPAVPLETLAAPGRARPASGDSQVPTEKPIYTRAQISKFYEDKRRGYYAGREAEVAAFEQDLGAAQREGRIR